MRACSSPKTPAPYFWVVFSITEIVFVLFFIVFPCLHCLHYLSSFYLERNIFLVFSFCFYVFFSSETLIIRCAENIYLFFFSRCMAQSWQLEIKILSSNKGKRIKLKVNICWLRSSCFMRCSGQVAFFTTTPHKIQYSLSSVHNYILTQKRFSTNARSLY